MCRHHHCHLQDFLPLPRTRPAPVGRNSLPLSPGSGSLRSALCLWVGGIRQHLSVFTGLFHSACLQGSSVLWCLSQFLSFVKLNSIPLCGQSPWCVSFPPWGDTWLLLPRAAVNTGAQILVWVPASSVYPKIVLLVSLNFLKIRYFYYIEKSVEDPLMRKNLFYLMFKLSVNTFFLLVYVFLMFQC